MCAGVALGGSITPRKGYSKENREYSGLTAINDVLYGVHDDGKLIEFRKVNGAYKEVKNWDVEGDLEGITHIPSDPNTLYIAVESPATVIIWDISKQKSTGSHTLKNFVGKGVEAFTYVSKFDVFLAGDQSTGKVSVYDRKFRRMMCDYDSSNTDLAGMTVRNDRIYYLFDDQKIIRDCSMRGITSPCQLGEAKGCINYYVEGGNYEGLAFTEKSLHLANDKGFIADIPI